jgi:hypothetical protein
MLRLTASKTIVLNLLRCYIDDYRNLAVLPVKLLLLLLLVVPLVVLLLLVVLLMLTTLTVTLVVIVILIDTELLYVLSSTPHSYHLHHAGA